MRNDKAAIDRLFKLQAKINMMVVDGTRDAEDVADHLQKILEKRQRRLTSLTSVMAPSNTINPHDFFKAREGLWSSSNFKDFILSGASKKVLVDETTIGYADLALATNDAGIGGELPEGYVFEAVDTFLAHLATLIEGQWGGRNGTLLNNGYANIFYVKVNGEVFAVSVHWNAGLRRWDCGAGRLDDFRWFAGRRAFSATAT